MQKVSKQAKTATASPRKKPALIAKIQGDEKLLQKAGFTDIEILELRMKQFLKTQEAAKKRKATSKKKVTKKASKKKTAKKRATAKSA